MAVDISAVVTFHDEGLVANASLLSVARARALAESQGLRVETIAVLDGPDQFTFDYLSGRTEIDRLLRVAHGDPGMARNSGVEAAQGQYVAFLDGDDMWGENWLAAAHAFAIQDRRTLIMHPSATLYFGVHNYLFVHLDMEDEDFDLLNLSMLNYWTTLSFARRETYASIPFRPRDLARQVGFEDWGWNWRRSRAGSCTSACPTRCTRCGRTRIRWCAATPP